MSNDPMSSSTKTSLDQRAATRRHELAGNWLIASQVSILLGTNAESSSESVTQRRREGQLLGAWVPSEQSYRYPTWQFEPLGQPMRQMTDILRLLREEGGMSTCKTGGWSEVEWFVSPHSLLDAKSPAELLATDPDRVLEAATIQFVTDNNAGGF